MASPRTRWACRSLLVGGARGRLVLRVINPQILEKSGPVSLEEGCLSVPDQFEKNAALPQGEGEVPRARRASGTSWRARRAAWRTCCQHEIDHLDGHVFVDHLSGLKRGLILFFLGAVATPLAALCFLLVSANAGWLFMAAALGYYLAYEWVHFSTHLPRDHWSARAARREVLEEASSGAPRPEFVLGPPQLQHHLPPRGHALGHPVESRSASSRAALLDEGQAVRLGELGLEAGTPLRRGFSPRNAVLISSAFWKE